MIKGSKMTEEQRQRLSEAHKGQHSSPKTQFKKGQAPWIKGKHHTEEAKRKMSEANMGKEGFWKNKHRSEETKKKLRGVFVSEETRRKLSEANKGQVPWITGKHHTEKTNEKNRLAHLGKVPRNKGKTNLEMYGLEKATKLTDLNRAQILKRYESGSFPRQTNTKPERQIKEELIKRGYKEGIDFIHQYKFMNKFMCDFCFLKERVIIEVDGDFWHINPKRYPEGSVLHKHQLKSIGRDKAKTAYIQKVDNDSWTLLRFWESDIKKDVVGCVDELEEVLNKKKTDLKNDT